MTTHKKLVLFDIDYTLFDTDRFKASQLQDFQLYDEVIPTLEELRFTADLGIFSEGDEELQRTKLVETMINDRFSEDHIHIVMRKIEVLDSVFPLYQERDVYLVDDKATILWEIQKKYQAVKTIWLKRGPYALTQPPLPDFSPYATVDTLREIIPFVNNK